MWAIFPFHLSAADLTDKDSMTATVSFHSSSPRILKQPLWETYHKIFPTEKMKTFSDWYEMWQRWTRVYRVNTCPSYYSSNVQTVGHRRVEGGSDTFSTCMWHTALCWSTKLQNVQDFSYLSRCPCVLLKKYPHNNWLEYCTFLCFLQCKNNPVIFFWTFMGALQSGIMYSFSLYQIMQSIVLKFGCKKKKKKNDNYPKFSIYNFRVCLYHCNTETIFVFWNPGGRFSCHSRRSTSLVVIVGSTKERIY